MASKALRPAVRPRLPIPNTTTSHIRPRDLNCRCTAKRRCYSSEAPASKRRPKTALFFPGQGVQRVGMADLWVSAFPATAKPLLDEIDSVLQIPLSTIIASGSNAVLTQTENAQPAIMAVSVLVMRILEREFGFATGERIDVVLGHSLGEFAALVAGGYLRFDDALRLVRTRAEVMARCSREAFEQEGSEFGMIALVCENQARMEALLDGIQEFLGLAGPGAKSDSADDTPAVRQVMVANINSKNQIVLSGNVERMQTLLAHLRQFGGHDPRSVRLKADTPFHNPLMMPAQETMKRVLGRKSGFSGGDMVAWPGLMPCISNVTGRPFRDRESLKDLLSRSCVETVQWWSSIKYLDQEEKVRRWIGVGPGKVGRNLVGKEVGMKGAVKGGGVWGITDPREIEICLKGLEDTENVEDEED
ncbi:malonyl-CoA-acyl carrier protein-like protein transacylase [Pseudovirgaria hyperparasitica]|uniref:[acyl-carrier-protein] S-malonyltransferase n=1 Tax=Pseudovirgaria hyperparasitica TaxID=470096 RepID=A0A6A6WC98_9PEZI|nr:malonyl-CoA-acyl carrier protein-like protein transacylase [Pseudovirgaria hyperparasitica]KAF2759674.1 malonyl-CoA-acyl carrier protein-like protein transacylase [Pseudovirgaria hyperparasitica]